MGPAGVWVPVSRGGQVLCLPPGSSADDVIHVLKAERVPVDGWLDAARSYLELGDQQGYLRILEHASSYATEAPLFQRVQLLCSMAAFHVAQFQRAEGKAKAGHDQKATQLLFQARKMAPFEQLTVLSAGQLAQAKVDACRQLTATPRRGSPPCQPPAAEPSRARPPPPAHHCCRFCSCCRAGRSRCGSARVRSGGTAGMQRPR